jgi:hypothetical protein
MISAVNCRRPLRGLERNGRLSPKKPPKQTCACVYVSEVPGAISMVIRIITDI